MRTAARWLAVSAAATAAVFLLRARPALYRVEGPSMEPALPDGTLALGVRAGRISPGDIVVIRDPLGPGFVVKRVNSSQQHGLDLWLVGDNPVGTVDSRTWGWIASSHVRARVVLAVKR